VTFYESNREVGPTGEEAGEFADDGPLERDPAAGTDPTRRPTGSAPLEPDPDAADAARDPDDDGEGTG
jgi:hypothetical protein